MPLLPSMLWSHTVYTITYHTTVPIYHLVLIRVCNHLLLTAITRTKQFWGKIDLTETESRGYTNSQIHRTHSQIPNTIKLVPNKASPIWVSSPNKIPNAAVAAKVVALVTGTAREMGALLRREKNVAEAERLIRKGTEYCQKRRRLIQSRRAIMILRRIWRGGGGGDSVVDDFLLSQARAPRRIRALVAPQTSPTATIFSMSSFILVPRCDRRWSMISLFTGCFVFCFY